MLLAHPLVFKPFWCDATAAHRAAPIQPAKGLRCHARQHPETSFKHEGVLPLGKIQAPGMTHGATSRRLALIAREAFGLTMTATLHPVLLRRATIAHKADFSHSEYPHTNDRRE